MEVSGQHHSPAALYPPGKGRPVPIGQEAGWAPELVWPITAPYLFYLTTLSTAHSTM
jgi:hypothetical protein